MNEPLASAAGNAVEVRNAVDYLTGAKRDPRLHARDAGARRGTARALRTRERRRGGARGAAARARLRRRGGTLRADGRGARRPEGFPVEGARALPARAGSRRRRAARAADSSTQSTCEPSGSPWSSLAAGGRAPPIRSTRRSGFTELQPIGAEVGPDAPLARVHARTRRRGGSGCAPPPRRLSLERRAARARRSGGRAHRRRSMSILFAAPGWNASPLARAAGSAAARRIRSRFSASRSTAPRSATR